MTEEKKVFTVNDYYKEQSPKKRKKILEKEGKELEKEKVQAQKAFAWQQKIRELEQPAGKEASTPVAEAVASAKPQKKKTHSMER